MKKSTDDVDKVIKKISEDAKLIDRVISDKDEENEFFKSIDETDVEDK